jgi:hypothetical protein
MVANEISISEEILCIDDLPGVGEQLSLDFLLNEADWFEPLQTEDSEA